MGIAVLAASCSPQQIVTGRPWPKAEPPAAEAVPSKIAPIGYCIQVGAFSQLDNAARLADALIRRGLDAYYFADKDGLFKVRFGDFSLKEEAGSEAETLKAEGVIDAYYLVSPDEYAQRRYGETALRNEIVKTAEGYIGLPYRWGGESAETGFDCSGLTMTVYRLNGLNLPRHSREQYRTGTAIDRGQLQRGDLIFFATAGWGRVSHVGIYAGGGLFIHAPKRGGTICTESLSKSYFARRYMGARTYLR